MALVKCYECGTEISEFAEKCPNCGAMGKKVAKEKIASGVFVMVVIAVAILFIFFKMIGLI